MLWPIDLKKKQKFKIVRSGGDIHTRRDEVARFGRSHLTTIFWLEDASRYKSNRLWGVFFYTQRKLLIFGEESYREKILYGEESHTQHRKKLYIREKRVTHRETHMKNSLKQKRNCAQELYTGISYIQKGATHKAKFDIKKGLYRLSIYSLHRMPMIILHSTDCIRRSWF